MTWNKTFQYKFRIVQSAKLDKFREYNILRKLTEVQCNLQTFTAASSTE